MKKRNKLKNILIVLGIIMLSIVSITFVYAGENDSAFEKHRYDGVYGVYDGPDRIHLFYAQRYTLNGLNAYCIEPAVAINTNTYSSTTDSSITGFSNDVIRYLRLVAYYSYDYPGHDTMNYYLAAQELMWEKVSGREVYWVTELRVDGPEHNISREKQEIISLIEKHTVLPSFDEDVIELNVGETVVLTDTNSIISEFDIYNTNLENVNISGNTLTITAPNNDGEYEIQFIKKNYLTRATLFYYSGNSQKLMDAGALDPVISTIKIKSIGGDVTINKLDSSTKENKPQGVESSLENAVYGVYNSSNTLITTITTDSDGYARSETLPELGEYYLKEITPSKGYKIDDTKYYFTIESDNLYQVVKVYEDIINRNVEINKFYAKAATGLLVPEPNVEFEIYDSKGNLVKTIKTDEQGFASTNLVYGTYTVKQVNTTPGYEKVEDFKIVINSESSEVIKYSLTNAPITAKLKLVKIDAESKEKILFSGVTFKIKNVDTGEYVCQKVNYPKQEEMCEFSTNELGEFITPSDLISGTYSIEEINSPSGYLKIEEAYTFRIDENSNFIEDEEYGRYVLVEFSNKKIMGSISVEKTGELFKVADNSFIYSDIGLADVEFSLYAAEDIVTLDGVKHYSKGDLIETLKTDVNGKLTFADLYLGKYIVKETKTLQNYVENNKEYELVLTEIDNETAIVSELLKVRNELKKGTLELTKLSVVDGEVIPNTLIEVYTENDELIFSDLTDENGKIIIPELKVGKYYILERESATGFVITSDVIYFEIKEDGEIIKATMENRPIYGTLQFSKIDLSDGTPLPNTVVEIFTKDDELVFSGKTDENGMIIIEKLKYGEYYILEKNAPEGYILNEEKMPFSIKTDGEIVKATMVNEKLIIEVPITSINEYPIIELVSSILLLGGIGVLFYVKTKKRK